LPYLSRARTETYDDDDEVVVVEEEEPAAAAAATMIHEDDDDDQGGHESHPWWDVTSIAVTNATRTHTTERRR
jgi:hypothetical protein